jgi:hypothetical protein
MEVAAFLAVSMLRKKSIPAVSAENSGSGSRWKNNRLN